jgi:hypothetical protein
MKGAFGLDLGHPLITSVMLPLTLAIVLTGTLRAVAVGERSQRIAASAIGLALIIAHGLTFGAPTWPAQSGPEKLALLFVLLLLGGIVLDIMLAGRIVTAAAACLAVLALTLWLAWPQLMRSEPGLLLQLTLVALLGLACLAMLGKTPANGTNRPAMLVVTALTLAGASFNAGSLLLMQVALALAAAIGGFALWNWPNARLPFHATGVAVSGIGCLALALLLVLLTEIRPWALLPLPLVFAAGSVVRRLPMPRRLSRRALEPVFITLIGLLPMLATIMLAQSPVSADDLYYQ